eukprot:gene34072-biopygen9987
MFAFHEDWDYEGCACAKVLKAVHGLRQARSVLMLAYVDDYLIATDSKEWYDTFVLAFHSSALRVDAEKARSAKEEVTSATTSTGDAELEKLRRLSYGPYAPLNPFPPRPDTLTDAMPKLFDLYGDKTHAALSKKSNSSMKYEQMVLGQALAYFHDAIVYEEETVDLPQNLPEAEYTPFLEELWNRVLRGHNTKKGVYGLLCNRYTMIGYRAMLKGDNEDHGGAEVVRAKLAFMEQKIYAGTEGVVADTILTKWLAEFDASKAKSVMTVTAKQAAGAANRAQRGDHRVGGGRGGDRALPPNSPGKGGKAANPRGKGKD